MMLKNSFSVKIDLPSNNFFPYHCIFTIYLILLFSCWANAPQRQAVPDFLPFYLQCQVQQSTQGRYARTQMNMYWISQCLSLSLHAFIQFSNVPCTLLKNRIIFNLTFFIALYPHQRTQSKTLNLKTRADRKLTHCSCEQAKPQKKKTSEYSNMDLDVIKKNRPPMSTTNTNPKTC